MRIFFVTIAGVFLYLLAGVASACCNLIDLSIYDRAQGIALPQYVHDGKLYVVGITGNEYQIVLRNPLSERILAVVSVDGINAVTGQTASPKQSGYVLSPGESVEIKGWRKSLAHTAAFYFTEHKDSYAARTGRGENTGVIGVAIFREKKPAPLARLEERPSDAAKPRAEASAPREQKDERLGTGHGRNEESPAQYTNFERASSTPDQVVTVYYDSYRNLVTQGVLQSREPEAFPGCFVPDPPRS